MQICLCHTINCIPGMTITAAVITGSVAIVLSSGGAECACVSAYHNNKLHTSHVKDIALITISLAIISRQISHPRTGVITGQRKADISDSCRQQYECRYRSHQM